MFECAEIRCEEKKMFIEFQANGNIWFINVMMINLPFSMRVLTILVLLFVLLHSQLRAGKYADADDDDPENSFVSVTIDLKSTS